MLPGLVVALIVLVALVVIAGFRRLRQDPGVRSGGASLSVYLGTGCDYRFFVGVPLQRPTAWVTVRCVEDGLLTLSSGQRFRPGEAESFVVAYESGELVDARNPSSIPLPESVSGLARPVLAEGVSLSALEVGRPQDWLEIRFGRSPTHPNDDNYYSTTLRNKSDVAVKVTKFAGFVREGSGSFSTQSPVALSASSGSGSGMVSMRTVGSSLDRKRPIRATTGAVTAIGSTSAERRRGRSSWRAVACRPSDARQRSRGGECLRMSLRADGR